MSIVKQAKNDGKIVLSDNDVKRIFKTVVGGGVTLAGLSALLGASKAQKSKDKALDIKENKGVIKVPISKSMFMGKLMSPEEFRKEYEAKHGVATSKEQQSTIGQMTQEDIDALKKKVLSSSGRRFDYFKAAQAVEVKDKGEDVDVSSSAGDPDAIKLDMRRSRAGEGVATPDHDDSTEQPRDELGRFTSKDKEDSSEKKADWFRDGVVWPMSAVASAAGITWLAGKISDKVSERRRKVAEEELAEAQQEYVRHLMDMDKTAGDENPGLSGWGWRLAGASLFIPMAFAAMISNRIMEKRYESKKKSSEMAGGTPDEPTFLYDVIDDADGDNTKVASEAAPPEISIMYKTASGEEINMSPESVMAMILVKSAMMDALDAKRNNVKEAQFNPAMLLNPLGYAPGYLLGRSFSSVASNANNKYQEWKEAEPLRVFASTFDGKGQPTAATYEFMDKNQDFIKSLIMPENFSTNDQRLAHQEKMNKAFDYLESRGLSRENLSKFVGGKGFNDYLAKNFQLNPEWRKNRDEYINSAINDKFGDNFFSKIIQWLARATGLGNWMFNRNLSGKAKELAGKIWTPPAQTSQIQPPPVQTTVQAPVQAPLASPNTMTDRAKRREKERIVAARHEAARQQAAAQQAAAQEKNVSQTPGNNVVVDEGKASAQ